MIRLVALDLVLRILLARMVDVSFVIHILPVNFHNPAGDVPGLGVPGHVIAYFEFTRHDTSPRLEAQPSRNEPFAAVRPQRSQRRFATSIVGFTSGGYDTFVTWLRITDFLLLSPSPHHQHVIDNDIKQTNLIAI
jgi:hypothetical protein